MPSIGTRRSTILKRRSVGLSERLILLVKKFGLFLGIAVAIFWIGAWLSLSGAAARAADGAVQRFYEQTASWGFSVKNVMVDGRRHTDPDTLKAMMGIEKNDPIFAFDPLTAKDAIEKIQWVKSARVERRLPDTIYIHLTERQPFALWQKNKKLVVVDRDGAVLTGENIDRYKDFVILVGDDAPKAGAAFLSMLEAEPELRNRVEAATLVGGRRWDLKLKSGATVKLPELDVGLALRKLAANHEEEQLLDKNVLIIDVRERGRITVRTKPGAAQDFDSGGVSPALGNPI